MQSQNSLYVDGSMLWHAIPPIPDNIKEYAKFEKSVLNKIKKTYKVLSKCKIKLDTISILHILKEFFTHGSFKEALKWVKIDENVEKSEIVFPIFDARLVKHWFKSLEKIIEIVKYWCKIETESCIAKWCDISIYKTK